MAELRTQSEARERYADARLRRRRLRLLSGMMRADEHHSS